MGEFRRICNGTIVTPTELIEKGTIVLEGNVIAGIEKGEVSQLGPGDVDATGMWILPGLVDTHSDAIEQEVQPRPTTVMPVASAFYELERRLVGQGITTMYHSLSLCYTGDQGNWVRRNENVDYLIQEIRQLTREQALIRHKIHLRYEMRNAAGYPLVEKLIKTNQIDQLSFMDHTPGKGQWHDVEVQKQKIMARLNLTPEEADQHILELQQNTNLDWENIHKLAELANRHEIPIASHDDDTKEKIALLKAWKARISEFPISIEVAEEAKRNGFYVVVGAPNLLLGGSHNHNLSSFEAIEAGVVDILCSDYYPGSLLQGIFYLYHRGFDLVEVVKLASLNPAKALGLTETGSIEEGKQADLLLVTNEGEQPKLHQVFVDGEMIFQVQYRKHLHQPLTTV